jgi:hypothetical protein
MLTEAHGSQAGTVGARTRLIALSRKLARQQASSVGARKGAGLKACLKWS